MSILIRPLKPSDVPEYRALRQKILAMGDGRYFSDSYTREAALTEAGWLEWCTEKQEHCILGTFANDELIGIMMITMLGLTKSPIVEWEATWLDPDYRKSGIGKMAYEQVALWTKRNGYQFAVVFIRADNARSREIREKQGFEYMHTKRNEVWADGSVADVHSYMLDLYAAEREVRQQAAIQYLTDTLEFLHDDEALQEAVRAKLSEINPSHRQLVEEFHENSA